MSKLGPEIHSGGIFSLDAVCSQGGFDVLTGSKDTTVSLSRVANEGMAAVTRFRDFSETPSVIKTVCWNPLNHQHFAAAGNDRAVHLFDVRQGRQTVCFEELHTMAVNTVDYNPGNEHQLLSSGFDQVIKVLDLRQTKQPLFTLQSHHVKGRGKASLTSPIFYLGGKAIATIGDNTTNLYRYSTATGELDSVVDIGFTPTCLQTFADQEILVAANAKSSIWLFPQGF